MILPFCGHHIADVGGNRYSYPSNVMGYRLKKNDDLTFHGEGYLSSDGPKHFNFNNYDRDLFNRHYKLAPASPLIRWKNTYTFEGISNDNQTD